MVAVFSAMGLAACGESGSMTGTWVQPVPGMPQMEQGFVLRADGTAASVNMATLAYESWKVEHDRLILSGKSIGNGQTIAFSDTFAIDKLTADSLVIGKGALKLKYARSRGDGQNVLPMVQLAPARAVETVEGTLTIGHEVRSLKVEGDSCLYWVVDKTGGRLYQQYDSITGGTKAGIPVHARLQVTDMGEPSGDGFAKGYDRVLQVLVVERLSQAEE